MKTPSKKFMLKIISELGPPALLALEKLPDRSRIKILMLAVVLVGGHTPMAKDIELAAIRTQPWG